MTQVDRPNLDAPSTDHALSLSRADFALLVRSYRRNWRSALSGVPFIGSLLLAWGAMQLTSGLGWPVYTQWLWLVGGWVIGLRLMHGVAQDNLRKAGLGCPRCGCVLADTVLPRGRDREVLVSGECPACKVALFPAEP
jgi:hypothetical protein